MTMSDASPPGCTSTQECGSELGSFKIPLDGLASGESDGSEGEEGNETSSQSEDRIGWGGPKEYIQIFSGDSKRFNRALRRNNSMRYQKSQNLSMALSLAIDHCVRDGDDLRATPPCNPSPLHPILVINYTAEPYSQPYHAPVAEPRPLCFIWQRG